MNFKINIVKKLVFKFMKIKHKWLFIISIIAVIFVLSLLLGDIFPKIINAISWCIEYLGQHS